MPGLPIPRDLYPHVGGGGGGVHEGRALVKLKTAGVTDKVLIAITERAK